MIVSYAHDDRVEEYSTNDLATIESAEVERVTGMEWDDVETALKSQKPAVMSAIIWVFRRRQTPGLRFADFSLAQWKKRLKARLEYEEILDLLEGVQLQIGADAIDDAAKNLRVLAHDPADVDRALAEMADPKAQAPAPARPVTASSTSAAPKDGSATSSTSTGP
ncbi:hypothetical protein [Streptomyces sp. JB150]|uniref:hypothetical protein n=1 Tax=Streptomyces sp. JB150 TaxID=2714844 RepID=UPI0014078DB2|nr:hypothetical protein [Streptomyces sp. JB150]QIJ62547.1 hypothetical protein G7Z13_11240 [Streptomyces sp. JB150]